MVEKNEEEIKIIKGPIAILEAPSEYETYYRFFEKSTIIKITKD